MRSIINMNSKITEASEIFDAKINSLKSGIDEDLKRINNRMNALAEDIEDLQLRERDFTGSNDSSKRHIARTPTT